jgi:hypothetical protein
MTSNRHSGTPDTLAVIAASGALVAFLGLTGVYGAGGQTTLSWVLVAAGAVAFVAAVLTFIIATGVVLGTAKD